MKIGISSVTALSLELLSGCASRPTEIQAQYVSPLQYKDYDCDQVSSELGRISRKTAQLFGQLDKTASNDEAQMAVGMILFWPALFFLEGGDGTDAAEYARLKGEFDALEQAAIQKQCDMSEFEAIREQEAKMLEEAEKKKQEDWIQRFNMGPGAVTRSRLTRERQFPAPCCQAS